MTLGLGRLSVILLLFLVVQHIQSPLHRLHFRLQLGSFSWIVPMGEIFPIDQLGDPLIHSCLLGTALGLELLLDGNERLRGLLPNPAGCVLKRLQTTMSCPPAPDSDEPVITNQTIDRV